MTRENYDISRVRILKYTAPAWILAGGVLAAGFNEIISGGDNNQREVQSQPTESRETESLPEHERILNELYANGVR